MGVVTVFVASADEETKYREALAGSEWADVTVVVACRGNAAVRDAMVQYYLARTHHLVILDDDIEDVRWMPNEGEAALITPQCLPAGALDRLLSVSFAETISLGFWLWGLNTSSNPAFLRAGCASHANGLVNGFFSGTITRPQVKGLCRACGDCTEDVEWSLRHIQRDGGVLRWTMYMAASARQQRSDTV